MQIKFGTSKVNKHVILTCGANFIRLPTKPFKHFLNDLEETRLFKRTGLLWSSDSPFYTNEFMLKLHLPQTPRRSGVWFEKGNIHVPDRRRLGNVAVKSTVQRLKTSLRDKWQLEALVVWLHILPCSLFFPKPLGDNSEVVRNDRIRVVADWCAQWGLSLGSLGKWSGGIGDWCGLDKNGQRRTDSSRTNSRLGEDCIQLRTPVSDHLLLAGCLQDDCIHSKTLVAMASQSVAST